MSQSDLTPHHVAQQWRQLLQGCRMLQRTLHAAASGIGGKKCAAENVGSERYRKIYLLVYC
jgi:hypothetical protein